MDCLLTNGLTVFRANSAKVFWRSEEKCDKCLLKRSVRSRLCLVSSARVPAESQLRDPNTPEPKNLRENRVSFEFFRLSEIFHLSLFLKRIVG